jgi:hypothetical protein
LTDSQRKQPITRHPLFPATVALWFGALFGLGSMAIKPSLLEKGVLALQLHTIIPAAEPPLGATTQILMALAAAAMGGIAGAILARRIARPRKVQRVRQRGAGSMAATKDSPAAPEWAGQETTCDSSASAVSRRRQLAIQEDAGPARYHDRAPLPGGAPHILNVNEFDLEGFEAEQQDDALKPAADSRETAAAQFEGRSDVSQPGEKPISTSVEPEPAPMEEQGDGLALQPGGPEERGAVDELAAIEDDYGAPFTAPDSAVGAEAALAEPAATGFSADKHEPTEPQAAQGQSADAGPPPASAPFGETTQEELQSVQGEDVDRQTPDTLRTIENVESVEFATSANEIPQPHTADDDEVEHQPGVPHVGEENDTLANANAETAAGGEPMTDAPTHAEVTAADRLLAADLTALSHAELLERLALSISGKRYTGSQAAGQAFVKAGDAASFADTQPETGIDDGATPEVVELDFSSPAAANYTRPAEDEAIAEEEEEEEEEEEVADAEKPAEDSAAGEAPAAPVIPAALRPIVFDDEDDGDEDILAAIVPPRSFSLDPKPIDAAPNSKAPLDEAGAGEDEPVTQLAELDGPLSDNCSETDGAGDHSDEEIELEEGYSSLLNLSRPDRQQFVRIEEPETDAADIRPFVVFPGDESGEAAPFAKPRQSRDEKPAKAQEFQAAAPELEVDERRFDRPGGSEGMQSSAPAEPDPEETERSLRAALATLQKMSGAA